MQIRTHGFSQQQLEQGRQAYNSVRVSYDDNKEVINKGNFMKLLWRFWHHKLRPLSPDLDRIVQWMLQSGAYVPATTWVNSFGGVQ
jgi:hypothetical protein